MTRSSIALAIGIAALLQGNAAHAADFIPCGPPKCLHTRPTDPGIQTQWVVELQRELRRLRLFRGRADGEDSDAFREAVMLFERRARLPIEGAVSYRVLFLASRH